MIKFSAALMVFSFTASPAFAEKAVNTCTISGFVKDKVDVYDRPDGKIIGTIPGIFTGTEELSVPSMPEVEISESKNGWFKIHDAKDNSALMEANEAPLRTMFAGEGWVKGTNLTVKSQSIVGYSAPDIHSKPHALPLKSNEPAIAFDDTEANHLIDCKADWARIEVNPSVTDYGMASHMNVSPPAVKDTKSGTFHVWVNKICGLQETSCDGTGE